MSTLVERVHFPYASAVFGCNGESQDSVPSPALVAWNDFNDLSRLEVNETESSLECSHDLRGFRLMAKVLSDLTDVEHAPAPLGRMVGADRGRR